MALTEEEREQAIAKQMNRARRGVLRLLKESPEPVSLGDLHEFTLKKYLIQHQRFSELMEGLVAAELIAFDPGSQSAAIGPKAEEFLASV